jgi:hypothetical protein
VALRLGDEPLITERPLLEPADPNAVSGPAGPGVRADEGSVVLDAAVLNAQVVHEHPHVRERDHE